MNSEFTIAVHALVFLNHKGESVSSDKLAANICTNPARVRKIMGETQEKGTDFYKRRGSRRISV